MKKKSTTRKHKGSKESPYPGRLMRAFIALIAAIYALLPFPPELVKGITLPRWFIYSFIVINTMTALQVILVQRISLWLDRKYKWNSQLVPRIMGQVLIGWTCLVGISIPISWFWFQYLDAEEQSIRYAYNAFMFKSISDSAVILNLVFLFLSFYGHYQRTAIMKSRDDEPVYPDHVLLFNSATKTETRVPVNDIAYICLLNKRTLILRQHDGSSHIFWDKLDKIKLHLDPARFSKVNRTHIISRRAVAEWTRCPDRGIILDLQPSSEQPVKVSREKAQEIILWIKSSG